MPIKQLSLHCTTCDAVLPHNQDAPNHVVHALVSLFLVGLWIPVWILIAIGSGKEPAACVKCGSKRRPGGAAVPVVPAAETRSMSATQAFAVTFVIGGILVAAFLIGNCERL